MNAREGFIFYRSFQDALEDLPAETYKAILSAVIKYALDGSVPELNGLEKSAFLLIKPQIDANNRRREVGATGGRPKAKQETENQTEPNETKENQTKPNETKENQVEPKEKEKVKDKDKVKVKEKEIEKEKPETASAMVDRLTAELGMSDDMRETLRTWVRYKTEKRQAYKAEGLRALIAQVHKAVQTYGEQAVISLVSDCMACGYQGIIFDRLRKDKPPDKKRTKFDNFPSHGTDYDALMWASVSGGIK